jgi:RNA recognition motif-containing protein
MRLQQSFKSVFAQHGEVVFAVVVVDKISGKNKGYGFVTYRHLDGALSALQEPSKEIDGRIVVSNLAAAGQLHDNSNNNNSFNNYSQLITCSSNNKCSTNNKFFNPEYLYSTSTAWSTSRSARLLAFLASNPC